MNLKKLIKGREVALIALAAILLGIIFNAFLTVVDRLIYPEDYYETVMKYSDEFSVPSELVFAVIKVESDFKSDAKSSVGAIGLMQMLPSTYEWLASKLGDAPFAAMLYDPETNIKYGTYYLQYLYAKFGTWEKAVIAYNWGEGNFARFLESHEYTEGEYSSIPVRETRNYVSKVMHHWEKYEDLYSKK